jgi:hypothetical protein
VSWRLSVSAQVVLLFSLSAAGAPRAATAQDGASTFLAAGYGVGGRRHGRELASGMAELVFQRGGNHIAVRAVAMGDLFGGSGDSFGEAGLLYGRAAHGRWGHVAIAAGAALTSTRCSPATEGFHECTILGLPVVGEASVRLARPVGLGVQVFANVNRKTNYGGVVVFLALGSLR